MIQSEISVLVLAYNHSRWIRSCMESLLNQNGVKIKVFVHDDNSTDDTFNILREYESFCTIIKNDSGINIGVSKSLNRLMDMATGSYIAFMSADDVWDRTKLYKQYQLMEEDKSIDLSFTGLFFTDENDEINQPPSYFLNSNLDRNGFVSRLLYGNCLLAPSAMLRRSSWVKNNRFNEALRELQDWDYWIRALCSGLNFNFINEPLTNYRITKSSISNSHTHAQASRLNLEVIKCLKSFLGLPLSELRVIYGQFIESHPIFIKDRSVHTGLAIILSLFENPLYKRAAGEILYDYFKKNKSNISDHEYHNFMGELGIS